MQTRIGEVKQLFLLLLSLSGHVLIEEEFEIMLTTLLPLKSKRQILEKSELFRDLVLPVYLITSDWAQFCREFTSSKILEISGVTVEENYSEDSDTDVSDEIESYTDYSNDGFNIALYGKTIIRISEFIVPNRRTTFSEIVQIDGENLEIRNIYFPY